MKAIASLATVLLLLAGGVGLVACSDDDDDDAATEATTTEEAAAGAGGATEIAMTEYAFEPREVQVAAGDTITATNDGELPHNYTFKGREGGPITTGDVDPGSSGEVSGDITMDLRPGEYEVICTIPGHAEQGMEGTLTIK